jgi:hypothetical protein
VGARTCRSAIVAKATMKLPAAATITTQRGALNACGDEAIACNWAMVPRLPPP